MWLQTGEVYIMHIRFDQADLDVAEANFVKLTTHDKLVPSCLSIFMQNASTDDAVIFASSYMQDCGLYSLKQSEIEDVEPSVGGRQRVNSREDLNNWRKKSVSKY